MKLKQFPQTRMPKKDHIRQAVIKRRLDEKSEKTTEN